tara:strand:+ start:209 stop:1255 length:1047 start_codon:yes stop_codon:yes gene_type:complete
MLINKPNKLPRSSVVYSAKNNADDVIRHLEELQESETVWLKEVLEIEFPASEKNTLLKKKAAVNIQKNKRLFARHIRFVRELLESAIAEPEIEYKFISPKALIKGMHSDVQKLTGDILIQTLMNVTKTDLYRYDARKTHAVQLVEKFLKTTSAPTLAVLDVEEWIDLGVKLDVATFIVEKFSKILPAKKTKKPIFASDVFKAFRDSNLKNAVKSRAESIVTTELNKVLPKTLAYYTKEDWLKIYDVGDYLAEVFSDTLSHLREDPFDQPVSVFTVDDIIKAIKAVYGESQGKTRAINCIKAESQDRTVMRMFWMSEAEWLRVPNLGRKSMPIIMQALKDLRESDNDNT